MCAYLYMRQQQQIHVLNSTTRWHNNIQALLWWKRCIYQCVCVCLHKFTLTHPKHWRKTLENRHHRDGIYVHIQSIFLTSVIVRWKFSAERASCHIISSKYRRKIHKICSKTSFIKWTNLNQHLKNSTKHPFRMEF